MTPAYVVRTCRFCRTHHLVHRALSGSTIKCPECRQSSWFSVDPEAAVLSGRERFPQEHEQAVAPALAGSR